MKNFLLSILLLAGLSVTAQVQKIQNLQVTGGTPGVGKVLVSDANGNASWQDPAITTHASSGTTVSDITSATGRVWMDRNLGASQVATSATDANAYGSLYQWGRGNDGHQLIVAGAPVNGTTTTFSPTNTPGNNLFILTVGANDFDWRSTRNDNLWQGKYGINNPCPAGYRLPTITELDAEVAAYSITNSTTAFASPLKFTLPGRRTYSSGVLTSIGSSGHYWSSTVSGISASIRYFSAGATANYNDPRAFGFTVRCLKD